MTALNTVSANARVFTRLFGLDVDPLHFKYSAGETDAFDALDCAAILLKETSHFVGKSKHVGKPFDFVDDVKADMAEMLLIDQDATAQAVKRKRNLPLFYLIVEPALESLRHYGHAAAIEKVDEAFNLIKASIFIDDNYSEYDDAVVAQAQVKNTIRGREEQIKAAASARKKRSRKIVKEIEAEINDVVEDDVE